MYWSLLLQLKFDFISYSNCRNKEEADIEINGASSAKANLFRLFFNKDSSFFFY